MKRALVHALCVVAVFTVLLPAASAEEVELLFEDGQMLRGEVLSTSRDTVQFRYKSGELSKVHTFDAQDLDPHSFYNVRALYLGDDASEHLALARFAIDHDMFSQARMLYETAKRLDEDLVASFDKKELPRILEGTASRLVTRAKSLLEIDDLDGAENNASIVLTYFSTTDAADEARGLIGEVSRRRAIAKIETEDRLLAASGKRRYNILLKNGRSFKGYVLSSSASGVNVEIVKGTGRATLEIEADDLDPHSYYEMRLADIGEDIDAHIALGKFALANRMFTRARAQYERVVAIDPDAASKFTETELPALLNGIAYDLLAEARLDYIEGRLVEAQRLAGTILTRFPDTNVADDALGLVQKIGKKLAADEESQLREEIAQHLHAQDEAQKERAEAAMAMLDPVRKTVDEARAFNEEGFKGFRFTRAERNHTDAARKYAEAIDQLKALGEQNPQNDELHQLIDKYTPLLLEQVVTSYVNAGGVSMENQQFDKASDFADMALAANADSEYAQSFRARVDAATAYETVRTRGSKKKR